MSSDNNVLYPDMIQINNDVVIYNKYKVFGYKTVYIPRNTIASVSTNVGLFFADIVICSYGGSRIVACGFSKSDAAMIVEMLRAD